MLHGFQVLLRSLVASKMAKSGKYDAVICLSAVIRGSTSYDYVCNEVSKALPRSAGKRGSRHSLVF